MNQEQDVTVLSLESVIETKLVQNNVTELVLSALKEKYGGMQLKALDDRESYLELKAAAKDCAKVRTLAVKICKEGREEAVKTQKLWIAKEKEVVGKVAEVEDALDAEIAKFDAEVERKETEEANKREEAYINRQATLTRMGATFADGSFTLGEASFEASLIKGSAQDVWGETIVPKFQVEYEKIESVRVAQEKEKAEKEAEMKRQQEELEKQQAEFKRQQQEFEKQKQGAERAEVERKQQLVKSRSAVLRGLGMVYDGTQYDYADIYINLKHMEDLSESEWTNLVSDTTVKIKEYKDAEEKRKKEAQLEHERVAEEKRLADIETAKQEAIQKEKQRIAEEEQKRQAELEAASDKKKWEDFIKQVESVTTFEMRSGQYRKKMATASDKLKEILAL